MMDLSSEFIKMCEKAEEIQTIAPGDKDRQEVYVYKEPWECGCGKYRGERYKGLICDKCGKQIGIPIWLPRQDQLQEMVLPDPNRKDAWGEPYEPDIKTDVVFWLFRNFADSIQEWKYSQQTAKQLWLRYVMERKYSKVWDGETWQRLEEMKL